ncbi:MAG: hypothetical protein HY774_25650 [Acidobacteria bacterium]|nr:hypothetical protein [Acidobacteriota bacterium]
MRALYSFVLIVSVIGVTGNQSQVFGQTAQGATTAAPATAPRIIGEVVAVNKEKRVLQIKTAQGECTVAAEDSAACKRVAPDAKTLDGAETIEFTDIRPGDRVWARSTTAVAETPNTFLSKQLVLMSATSIAERNKLDQEAWRRRGVRGEVVAADVAKNEFTLKLRDGQTVLMKLAPQADIRRFPPGSYEFTASKPITASEIKIGETLMCMGDRSPDGTQFSAERVVTGDVPRPTFGQVKEIRLEKKEIVVQSREGETVVQLTSETLLRQMPEELREQPANGGGNSEAQPQRRQGRQGMRMNPEAMMERLKQAPELKLTELKVGEYVMANGPKSTDGKSVTALFLVRVPAPNFRNQGPSLSSPDGGLSDPGSQQ